MVKGEAPFDHEVFTDDFKKIDDGFGGDDLLEVWNPQSDTDAKIVLLKMTWIQTLAFELTAADIEKEVSRCRCFEIIASFSQLCPIWL